jgi:hypothetical protein
VNLVDVRLLRCELDIISDLVADRSEELIVDEVVDDSMLVRCRSGVVVGVRFEYLLVEQSGSESLLGFFCAESYES